MRALKWKNVPTVAMHYDSKVHYAQAFGSLDESVKVPHPREEQQEFVEFLIRNSGKWKDALLVETNDDVLIAISKHKAQLEKHYRITAADWPALNRLIDKRETYSLAAACDVLYPKTFFPKIPNDLINLKDDIRYPSILKPVIGHLFFTEFHAKNFRVDNFDDLLKQFIACVQSGHEMLVQEIIPGPDSNIYQCAIYIDTLGETKAAFTTRKLRQNPPQFGVARVAISVEIFRRSNSRQKKCFSRSVLPESFIRNSRRTRETDVSS